MTRNETMRVKQLEFYGGEDLELVISRNENINLELTKLNGLGIVGISLTNDEAKQLIEYLTKSIKDGK